MSKYEPLWTWIRDNRTESFVMTFGEIEKVIGFTIDNAFLTFKKELTAYGFRVGKISMKEKTVVFEREEGKK